MEKNPLYAIHGVKQEPGNPDNLIRVPDEEAQFFSIYFNDQAVGDYPSRQAAEAELQHYVNLRVNGDPSSKPEGQELPPLPVENLSQFAQLIKDWHDDNQKQIALASNPPKEVVIKAIINGKERVLSASERQAFIAGVQVAGAIFKDLPFKIAVEEVEAAVEQSNG
ncbi:terminase small subunit [Kosakonia phage Kc283]|uniref:Terminase small subunit n=1 Tax=Kosakonia phage Kc283 TaxID=2863195 RepID=A0AAE8BGF7_9CAUD|nr:Mu Gam-like end protection [Kosakonia phage Kc283]QYN79867.1 terminase small subunit [Kosakonia phage Kc283]